MIRIKICGITNEEDALLAVNAGADAIGFIIDVPVKTPRKINLDRARKISMTIPPFVSTVAVLMPKTVGEVEKIINELNPSAIQLHGNEPPEFISEIKEKIKDSVKLIKVIHIYKSGEVSDPEKYKEYKDLVDAILLDTQTQKMVGGTGEIHDWKLSKEIQARFDIPTILSGGLNPENVKSAIEAVRPYAVDVSSGVEILPGKKDPVKVKKFVQNALSNWYRDI